METSSNDDAVIEPTTEQNQQPKIPHDNGHDNRVFADETGMPHLNRPMQNHYNHNGQYNNGHPPQSFRILENSRL